MILAVGSVVAGFVGLGKALSFNLDINSSSTSCTRSRRRSRSSTRRRSAVEWVLIALSVAVAVGGILLARRFYFGSRGVPSARRALAERFPALYTTVANKYYVDEIYGATVVAGTMNLAKGSYEFDARVVDGAVNGTRHLTVGTSFLSGLFDLNVVDGARQLGGGCLRAGRAGSCGVCSGAWCRGTRSSWLWASC